VSWLEIQYSSSAPVVIEAKKHTYTAYCISKYENNSILIFLVFLAVYKFLIESIMGISDLIFS